MQSFQSHMYWNELSGWWELEPAQAEAAGGASVDLDLVGRPRAFVAPSVLLFLFLTATAVGAAAETTGTTGTVEAGDAGGAGTDAEADASTEAETGVIVT